MKRFKVQVCTKDLVAPLQNLFKLTWIFFSRGKKWYIMPTVFQQVKQSSSAPHSSEAVYSLTWTFFLKGKQFQHHQSCRHTPFRHTGLFICPQYSWKETQPLQLPVFEKIQKGASTRSAPYVPYKCFNILPSTLLLCKRMKNSMPISIHSIGTLP